MQIRLVGEKKSDEAPALGPGLRALLASIWGPPVFPVQAQRVHPVSSIELPALIAQRAEEDPDDPAIQEMRAEVADLVKKHGYFFIEAKQ
jgi:hypothetical protein